MPTKNYILSIAGFDPSCGAGLSSDIKTFEAHGLYGLSVCTAITVQNDVEFRSCQWLSLELILDQIAILFERFSIDVVKIGVVENWEILYKITDFLKQQNLLVKIVLDPVLKTTTGYAFHSSEESVFFEKAIANCLLVTPNYLEIEALFPSRSIEKTIQIISDKTYLYLKGGHRTDKKGWDELYYQGILQSSFPPKVEKIFEKHGSGCVLSASIVSNLALNHTLTESCVFGKRYIEQFLNSTEDLLGVHQKNSSK